jgi:hypothetical protein
MSQDESSSTAIPSEPRTVSQDIACPMCGYNLRGLVEPRCPECGYPFDWQELIDAELRTHPFLFEHHPEGNTWSAVRTLIAGVRFARFWQSVKAGHRIVVPRLLLYLFMMVGVPALLLVSVIIVGRGYALQASMRADRQMALGLWRNPPLNAPVPQPPGGNMTVQQYFDQWLPLAPSVRFFSRLRNELRYGPWPFLILFMVTWPALTWLALQVFVWSMVRASVNPRHVMRCVVYSSDAAAWIALPAVFIATAPVWRLLGLYLPDAEVAISCIIGVTWLWASAKLVMAYRRYLRFPHSIATVFAAQVVTMLAIAKLAMMWNGY